MIVVFFFFLGVVWGGRGYTFTSNHVSIIVCVFLFAHVYENDEKLKFFGKKVASSKGQLLKDCLVIGFEHQVQ